MAIIIEGGIVVETGISIGDFPLVPPPPKNIVTDAGDQIVTLSGDDLVTLT